MAGESNGDAWKEVDALITMLPNGEIVRDVLLGEAGIARHLRLGKIHHFKTRTPEKKG